jgi:hypothetical protein
MQDAVAALNGEFHRDFNRAACSGLKLPLQESFHGQFVQVLEASALDNFNFVHQAALRVDGQAETASAFRAVGHECNRILGLDFFYQAGRRSVVTIGSVPWRWAAPRTSLLPTRTN